MFRPVRATFLHKSFLVAYSAEGTKSDVRDRSACTSQSLQPGLEINLYLQYTSFIWMERHLLQLIGLLFPPVSLQRKGFGTPERVCVLKARFADMHKCLQKSPCKSFCSRRRKSFDKISHFRTYSLLVIPWNRKLLKAPLVAQLVNTFLALYGCRSFIPVLKRASYTSWIQSISSYSTYFRCI